VVDLDEQCRGWGILADFLERLYKKKQSGRNVSKGVLAMSVKIPITKLLNGYTTSEASVITRTDVSY
jgi:hypothetical protein